MYFFTVKKNRLGGIILSRNDNELHYGKIAWKMFSSIVACEENIQMTSGFLHKGK